MFDSIKQWFHKRKMYRALGIKGSVLKGSQKWSSIGIALKELERLDTERANWLYAALKLRSANKQQPTAPCCSVEDSHIPEAGTSA
jgi:hypothetical protein